MTSVASLVELGERYWALGLPAAARSAFSRALAQSPLGDATAARRLAEVALAVGDAASARRHAAEVARREPGPAARHLLGQAQLAAGEIDAARLSFLAALDAPAATAVLRAQSRMGLAVAASAQSDAGGAAANVMAALEDLVGAVAADAPVAELGALVDREIALVEELAAQAASLGRGADAAALIEAAARTRGSAWSARPSARRARPTASAASATMTSRARSPPRPRRARARAWSGCAWSSASCAAATATRWRAPAQSPSSSRSWPSWP